MASSVAGAVARREQENASKAGQVNQFLASMTPEIQRALPRGLDANRVARLALTAARRTPALLDCSRESFAGAILTCSALGLEPDLGGEAYLVPYRAECTLIVGYQGLAKLYWQHPLAHRLGSAAVYEGDDFDYAYGLDAFLRHRPSKAAQLGDQGDPVAFYAYAELKNGGRDFVVLSPAEAKALRGGKVGPDPRFQGGDPMRWMERKTALRQLLKTLPKSTQMVQALEEDERAGTELFVRRLQEQQPQQQAIAAPAEAPPAAPEQTPAAQRTPAPTPARQAPAQPTEEPPAEDVQDAEVVTNAPDGAPMSTQGQWSRLGTLFTNARIERPQRLRWLSQGCGRPITSMKDLTRQEAMDAIDALDNGRAPYPDPVEEVAEPDVPEEAFAPSEAASPTEGDTQIPGW